MSLRPYIEILKQSNLIIEVHDEVKFEYGVTEHLQTNKDKAVMFYNIEGSHFPLLGNCLSSREQLKLVLDVELKRQFLIA